MARLDVTELWVSLAWLCMFSHSHAHTMSLYTHRVLGTSVLGSGAGMPLDLQQPPPGDDVCGVHLWHPHGTVSFCYAKPRKFQMKLKVKPGMPLGVSEALNPEGFLQNS